MEISKMLTISTCHITKETAKFIDNVCKDNNLSILIVYDKSAKYSDCTEKYGWFIYCNVALPDLNVPEDLLKVMCFTRDNNCDWLCLDRDGEVVDGLDVYEW
jgi:hypothetical protein